MSQISIAPAGGGSVGNVTGPVSSTDNSIATFDGTNGQVIQSSGASVDDSGVITSTGYISTDLVDQGILFGSATGQIDGVGSMTDGQIAIGVTGGDPVAGTITAGSNITIVNSAGGITISSTGGGSLTFTSDSGTASPSSENINFLGTNGLSSSASGSTVTYTIATATAGATAGAATQGSASFDSADFDVTAGFVSLVSPGITVPDYSKIVVYKTDFIEASASSIGYMGYVETGGVTYSTTDPDKDHPGIVEIETSASTLGVSLKGNMTSNVTIFVGGGGITLTSWCKFDVDPTQGSFRFGLVNNATTVTDGIYWNVPDFSSSADLEATTTASSTATATSSGINMSTSWVKLSIVINDAASSVAFYINDVLEATNTTNIIANSVAQAYVCVQQNSGQNLLLDFIEFNQTLSGTRDI